MEYVIIGLLILLIILVIILILKDSKKDTDSFNRLEINVIKEISDFKNDFSRSLTEYFNNQTERLDTNTNVPKDYGSITITQIPIDQFGNQSSLITQNIGDIISNQMLLIFFHKCRTNLNQFILIHLI